MKKLDGIEIIFIIASLITIMLAPINAYRVSSLFVGNEIEQLYIYETILFGVSVTIFLIYIAVFIKYNQKNYPRAYILIRLFPAIILCLYDIGFLIGLNFDSIRHIDNAFEYEMLMPWWAFTVLNIAFMTFNILLFKKVFILNIEMRMEKYQKLINVYSVVLIILYFAIFMTLVTDSANHLGLLEW